MEWKTIARPRQFGRKRDEKFRRYDSEYGKDNWRLMWQWGKVVVPYETACQIYEQGYYADSYKREDFWKKLLNEAKDVYDHEEFDTKSGLDYLVQNSNAPHLQDITIRRVVLRRGWEFKGENLVQINSRNKGYGSLSPGRLPFHLPNMIIEPHLRGWWDYGSIEDFYQSNKVLQIKKGKNA